MKELIIVCLIALVITPILATFNVFHLKQDPEETMAPMPFDVVSKITVNPGVVGCLSKESLQEITQHYLSKNSEEMRRMMNEGLCIYFRNGDELTVRKNACAEDKKDNEENIFVSLPKNMKSEFYFPCAAIR